MPIKLSKLVENTREPYRIRILGGADGLDHVVSWAHIMEDLENVTFLRGSELILTTCMAAKPGGHGQWLCEFIRRLHAQEACGILINTGKNIPSVPAAAAELANELGFPLLAIPWEIHLVDIVRDFCNRIFETEQNEESVTKAFQSAIFTPADRERYEPFLTARGYRMDAGWCVLVVHEQNSAFADKEQAERFDTAARNLLNRLGVRYHIFRYQDKFVLIFTGLTKQEEVRRLAQEVEGLFALGSPGDKLRLGVGPVVQELSKLRKTYKRALLALRFTDLTGEPVAFFGEMGLYRMLMSTDDTDLLREMLDETLGKLIAYDAKNKSDNIEILRLYIKNNFSVQQVSAQTYMHRNTVNYRVRKIKEILGTDLESMDEKLRFLLAFYIYDMLK